MNPVEGLHPSPHCRQEEWFLDVDETKVKELLTEDGMFLVRPSRSGERSTPLTLCVFFKNRIINLRIQVSNNGYSLMNANSTSFSSVRDLIDFYREESIQTAAGLRLVPLRGSPSRDREKNGGRVSKGSDCIEQKNSAIGTPPRNTSCDDQVKDSRPRRLRPHNVLLTQIPLDKELLKEAFDKVLGRNTANNCPRPSQLSGSVSDPDSAKSTSENDFDPETFQTNNTTDHVKSEPKISLQPRPSARLKNQDWFLDVDRKSCDHLLTKEGQFLVRRSTSGGTNVPYVLSVYHSTRVHHLQIQLKENKSYVLGLSPSREKEFRTIMELVNYYRKEPIVLVNMEGNEIILNTSASREEEVK